MPLTDRAVLSQLYISMLGTKNILPKLIYLKLCTGGWRKLHNEELHNLHTSQSIIRMIKSRRMSRAHSTNGEKRNAYKILMGKP
jgi:hypothetical protein